MMVLNFFVSDNSCNFKTKDYVEDLLQIQSKIPPDEIEENADLIHYGGGILPNLEKMKHFWKKMVELLDQLFA